MFEKDPNNVKYIREDFSIEEKLYENYISMRKNLKEYESYKYSSEDPYINSQEFKQGFIAGVKIISSIILDI